MSHWLKVLGVLGCVACSRGHVEARPVVQTAVPPLYGFWGLNGFVNKAGLQDVKQRLGLGVFHTSTRSPRYAVQTLLPLAQSAGVRVTLRLTGDHEHYTTAGGEFDLDAWKAALEPWQDVDLAPFVADGTLVAHMLLDDIHNFAAQDPTAAELDEMARTSKLMWPGLPTFVREKATRMPVPDGGRYHHVDAIVNQYRHREGDVVRWTEEQSRTAAALDVGVINGLNIANGGDGSSHQPGWQKGRFAMSADEIRRHGAVLAADPRCAMFLNWEYDGEEQWSDGSIGAAWFDRPENTAALMDLAHAVSGRPAAPLSRSGQPAAR